MQVPSQTRRRAAGLPFILFITLLVPAQAPGQGLPLDHDAYDLWRTIQDERISADGRHLLYRLAPRVGDATLKVMGEVERSLDRASQARFSPDSRFVVATIRPAHDSVRALRLGGTRSADLPPDTLGILDLGSGEVVRIAGVKSWRLPDRGRSMLAYLIDHEPAPQEPEDVDETDGEESTIPTLVLRDLTSGAEHEFQWAADYGFDERGTTLAYTTSGRDGAADGLHRIDTATGAARTLLDGKGRYLQLAVSPTGDRVAVLTDRDDPDADQPEVVLYAWSDDRQGVRAVARQGTRGVPAGWWPSEHGSLRFSESGRRLFFGIAPRPAPEPKTDSLLDDERVRVDVWHWRDETLQPMQLLNADRERRRSYDAVAHLDRGDQVVQLADRHLPTVRIDARGDADLALAETDVPYRALVGIEAPGFSDIWIVNVRTGDRRLVVENRQVAGARLSPNGGFVSWYDHGDRHWHALDTRRDRRVVLTAALPYPVWDETDDHPMPPRPYGQAGWTEGDRELLVYDRYDIWALDPTGRAAPRAVTGGAGRDGEIRFRYVELDPRARAISGSDDLLLSAFHHPSRDAGFYLARVDGGAPVRQLVREPKRFSRPVRAEDADRLLYTREDVAEFPDLWVTDTGFQAPRRVSHANPQQSQYNWATVELVDWISATGVPLQGLLYKPEDFDPSRAYPMMVYFYDRHSDDLHQHTPPLPHRSVIRPTFYASRGYIVFVPDIVYQIGYPGKSALDAVMPGTLKLAAEPWVDETRVGVQGHSWGGYQIAYMITRTNFFRAAGAGAPVANMTSAYGGIRWGTGLSRVFQYERTQSRIGGSLWEEPLRYIENSPLFALDRVETPVLIMHNEDDGHVPWEQGIELFVGLRRLGKPAWLINYNEQPHWPITAAKIRDWNIRMQQFFDHFLRDAPAPVWLIEGIPAVEKGRTLGLELVEDPRLAEKPEDRPGGR